MDSTKPGLMGALHSAKIVTLKQCVRAAGPASAHRCPGSELAAEGSVSPAELLDLSGPLLNVCSKENLSLLDTDGLFIPGKKRAGDLDPACC